MRRLKKGIAGFKWNTPIQAEYFIFAIPPNGIRCRSEIDGPIQNKGTSLQKWKSTYYFNTLQFFTLVPGLGMKGAKHISATVLSVRKTEQR